MPNPVAPPCPAHPAHPAHSAPGAHAARAGSRPAALLLLGCALVASLARGEGIGQAPPPAAPPVPAAAADPPDPAAAAAPSATAAGNGAAPLPGNGLPPITVTAIRLPRAVLDVPATVTVIDAGRIEDELATDIKDLVRFEPGVSVRAQPARFTAALASTGRDGNAGFNIRGLEGNRVLIQVDGIRLPDAFSFGAQSVGRGDYVDLEVLKSVEILRGPASALYGSDGLAGAVSFITRDPEDFLADGDRAAARARVAYAGADESMAEGLLVAGRAGALAAMAAYTRRDAGPPRNRGRNEAADVTRTAPNPQDIAANSLLAKLVWRPAPAHRLRLTGEWADRAVVTDVLSARTRPPLAPTSVLRLDARDTSTRSRASLDWRFTGEGLLRAAQAGLYWQRARVREFSAEDRNTAPDRTRDNRFDTRVLGLSAQAELGLATGALAHVVTAGADLSTTRQTGLRTGTVPPFGETFPTKAFPDTDYLLVGLFVQDEISLPGGAVRLYPALRLDGYRLEPRRDPLFPGATAGQSGQRLTPRFGAIGWVTDALGVFANYAAGFKAPTPSQVNNGFSNLASGYVAIPNPDLRPESSETVEAGLRLRELPLAGARLSASIAGYAGWYRDFIEQRVVRGSFRPGDPAVFQFVNAARVRIHGVEGRADLRIGPELTARLAGAWTRGTSREAGVARDLSSVDPVKLVGGLEWRDAAGRFGVQAIATHVARRRGDRLAEPCAPGCFIPPAFQTLDLTAFWRPAPALTLRLGLFNLTNETYWWWSDVRGLSATSPVLDAFTQPGRTVSASATLRF